VLQSLAEVEPIDAHVHVFKRDRSFSALLDQLHLQILDITLVDDRDPFFKDLRAQLELVSQVVRASPRRIALCTSFSPYAFEQPGFDRRVIEELDDDFERGAVAVKIYKTIGMEIRRKAGTYLMADDPVFDPIYQEIARRGRTVVAHLAEPTSCWEAPNPASPDYDYYRKHPNEYAYLHPNWPSKQTILRARDHMLQQHPELRVVGAHLGSMERDVDEIAQHFDRYPNFAVDTAARVQYLMLQPRDKVRAFLFKYQDRVLYGTDLELTADADVQAALREWKAMYARDWRYFATYDTVEYKGHSIGGLGLPRSVLDKLYHSNAIRWIPGIDK
jgi:predicted TIM-barrel fold metal-dependent hydrolase